MLFVDAGRMKPAVRGNFDSVKTGRLIELVSRYRQGRVQERTEWYGTASQEEIWENEGILSPNLYIAVSRPRPSQLLKGRKELEMVIDKLSALPMDGGVRQSVLYWKNAEAARSWEKAQLPQIYEVFGGVMKRKGDFGKGFPMLDVKTVLHTPYVPERFTALADVTEEEKGKYDIRRGDVFLNRTSETTEELACCSVAAQNQEAVYCGFIKRLRPRTEVLDPLYASRPAIFPVRYIGGKWRMCPRSIPPMPVWIIRNCQRSRSIFPIGICRRKSAIHCTRFSNMDSNRGTNP